MECLSSVSQALDARQVLLGRVAPCRKVRFSGSSAAPESVWVVEGQGGVRTALREEALFLFEEGSLQRNEAVMPYQASWVLECGEGGDLWLGHARQGKPVRLVRLVAVTAELWTSGAAHLCGEDCYDAELRMTDSGVRLDWVARGPQKNHRIARQFSLEAD